MSFSSTFKSNFATTTRLIFRFTIYAFLLTLPFTFFPLLSGISAGITFHIWNHGQVKQHINSLLLENEMATWQNYMSVPGAITFSDYLDDRPPFHIPQLTTKDWAEKLGVILPNEHQDDATIGVDKLVSLDGLVRSVDQYATRPKYWVYVTSLPEWRRSPWDQAFDRLLQRLYVNPLPSETAVLYLDCAATGFLCGVWGLKYPSLVHFTVLDESLADHKANHPSNEDNDGTEYTYPLPLDTLYPVAVRVIELPLAGEKASKLLPRATFPVPDLQLRALFLDPLPDELLSEWDTYSTEVQTMRRFQDHYDHLCQWKGKRDYYINEADHWYNDNVMQYLGLDFDAEIFQLIQGVAFGITLGLAYLIHTPFSWIWILYAWYFGLGWDGSPENTKSYSGQVGENGAESNMWNDMIGAFWLQAAQNITAQMSEKAAKAAVTEA